MHAVIKSTESFTLDLLENFKDFPNLLELYKKYCCHGITTKKTTFTITNTRIAFMNLIRVVINNFAPSKYLNLIDGSKFVQRYNVTDSENEFDKNETYDLIKQAVINEKIRPDLKVGEKYFLKLDYPLDCAKKYRENIFVVRGCHVKNENGECPFTNPNFMLGFLEYGSSINYTFEVVSGTVRDTYNKDTDYCISYPVTDTTIDFTLKGRDIEDFTQIIIDAIEQIVKKLESANFANLLKLVEGENKNQVFIKVYNIDDPFSLKIMPVINETILDSSDLCDMSVYYLNKVLDNSYFKILNPKTDNPVKIVLMSIDKTIEDYKQLASELKKLQKK